MSLVTLTEAIILRTYNFAEADKIVVCLTLQNGVVRGVAQGARKLKSKFGAGLEPFTCVLMTYRAKEDKELVTVQNVDIIQTFFPFSTNPEAFADWAYLGELIIALSPPQEPNPKLYNLARACMGALAAQPERSRAVHCYFCVWLLKLAGLLPGWRSCLRCQTPLTPAAGIYVDSQYRMYCGNCRPAVARILTSGAYTLLTATRKAGPAEFVQMPAAAESWEELERMTQALVQAAL